MKDVKTEEKKALLLELIRGLSVEQIQQVNQFVDALSNTKEGEELPTIFDFTEQ